jgi:ABC-type lipoprotein export system ATPase subunit
MSQQPGGPTGRRIETELRRGAEPIGTFREALVRFRHVFKIYRVADTGVVALGGVDFDVGEGEFLAVVGPSGSGKSTILNMIGGLDRASAGTVEVEGRDLGRLDEDELTAYRRDRVGFVWQGTARNLVPYLNVVENVRLPSTASGVKIPAARRTPRELLEVVGLPHRANHRPGQLSGGEQQRVAVAVALSNLPMILLADEPTAELDSESAALVLDAFQSVNHEFGVTIVMVTHDLLAAKRAHRQLRLRDGQLLVEGRPMEPLGTDGRARLPDEAVDALSGMDLEVEVRDGEVRIRRKGEGGLIGE